MNVAKSYFGLEIVDGRYVRLADIENLPFFDFWSESALGSVMQTDTQTGVDWVHLGDWEAFSRLFIKTGRHRYLRVGDPK